MHQDTPNSELDQYEHQVGLVSNSSCIRSLNSQSSFLIPTVTVRTHFSSNDLALTEAF